MGVQVMSDERSLGCPLRFLVYVILPGAFLAIVLPSYFNQAGKLKQSEAKQYVSSMNRAQQAYYLENSRFSASVEALGLGITTQTTNYSYSIRRTANAAYQYGVSRKGRFKSCVGGVFREMIPNTKTITTFAILCEAKAPGRIKPADPIYVRVAPLKPGESPKLECAPSKRSFDFP